MYRDGDGVEEDYEEAIKWFKKSVDQGYATAQWVLGTMYENGCGCEQNYEEAARLYRLSAEQGNADGEYRLGKCYHEGKGIPTDYREAYDWYVSAALQDHEMAKNNLGILFYIEKHPELEGCDPSEDADVTFGHIRYGLGDALLKARDKRAEEGNIDSQYAKGVDYYIGKYCEQDYVKAREWLSKPAEKGHAKAQCLMGHIYMEGLGTDIDYVKAREWYAKSAEQGVPEAEYKLAIIYQSGYGVKRDKEKAFDWCLKSAEQGLPDAQYMLAKLYAGEGIIKDIDKAKYWYNLAVKKGVTEKLYIKEEQSEKDESEKFDKTLLQYGQTFHIVFLFAIAALAVVFVLIDLFDWYFIAVGVLLAISLLSIIIKLMTKG
ncbi:MAG: SEL1-like repeat protein [Prevotellaceae bacterium]|nr:SEL1-like repeat protein [Candidatus Faecinaster equi]